MENQNLFQTTWIQNLITLSQIERSKRQATRHYSASASSVDTCFLKQFRWAKEEEPSDDIPEKSLIKMRIGTLIHQDIQRVLLNLPNIEVEKPLISHRYGIEGRADIVEYINKDTVRVVDIKVVDDYSYKKMFGRDAETGGIIEKYKKQVAICAEMLIEAGYIIESMSLYIINRNDARSKMVDIPLIYIDMAVDYFERLYRASDDIKPLTKDAPVHNWECKYCEYKTRCLLKND